MTAQPDTIESVLRGSMRPPPNEKIWQWAEREIYLTAKVSPAAPGRYDTRHTPALRGLFDMAQDGGKRQIAIKKSAQAGVTLWGYIVIAWKMCNDPLPAGISMPSVDACRKKSEKVFQPIITGSKALRDEMPINRDKFKILEQDMKSLTITWMGATKASQLASDTFGVLLVDEPDKYPIVIAGESTPLMLLLERTATIWNHLIMLPCTPTTEHGLIHTEHAKGDRCEYAMPCGFCGAAQVIKWKSIKFDSKQLPEAAGASAYFECSECKGKIGSTMKNDMLDLGEWRATARPETADRASAHYPRWLSTWESGSFESIVTQFMQVRHKPNELRGWINNTLAEAFVEERIDLSDEELLARKMPYKWGQVPNRTAWGCDWFDITADEGGIIDDDLRVIITVDVQKAHFWVCAREWKRGGDSAGIEFQMMWTWDEIDAYAARLGAWIVVVDAAYGERTTECYQACIKYDFVPCMGREAKSDGRLWNQTTINPFEGTRRQREGGLSLQLVLYESHALRNQLIDRMNGYTLDEDKKRYPCPFRWAIPEDAPTGESEYVDQVTAEMYDPAADNDKGAWVIKKGKRDNHAWDCEVMQILAAEMMGFNSLVMT